MKNSMTRFKNLSCLKRQSETEKRLNQIYCLTIAGMILMPYLFFHFLMANFITVFAIVFHKK